MMPYGYLAIHSTNLRSAFAEQSEALVRRLGMRQVMETAGTIVWAGPATPVVTLDGEAGIIIGTLFRKGAGSRRIDVLDRPAASAIRRSSRRALIEHYWGGYVAFLPEVQAAHLSVVRDPSGTMPCYYLRRPECTVIASDVETMVAAGLLVPAIAWDGLARHLLATQLRTEETCIEGVAELPRGCSVTISVEDLRKDQVWDPWAYVEPALEHRDRAAASKAVRDTVLDCIGAWASCFEHSLLAVSGGLDSSIVAAALHHAGRQFSCITLYTDDPSGDERSYARVLAAALDAPLFEERLDVAAIDPGRCDGAHLPRPIARSFAQAGNARHVEVTSFVGADVFFNGGGGDNVFCNMQSAAPIVDRWKAGEGIRPVLDTAQDICRLTGCTWREAIVGALRKARAGPAYRWTQERQFLHRDVAAAFGGRRLFHPWLEVPTGAFPGKALHIALLLRIENHLEGFGRERHAPVLSPLMAQPIAELCLRIPTWMWCAGGQDRAAARHAFTGMLPDALIARRSHGTPASFATAIYETYRGELREMLLGGLLAREGLLDRRAIEHYLADPAPTRGLAFLRLLALADAESWAQAWSR